MKSQNPYPDGFKVEFPNYPFGMLMRERTFSSTNYRFGFNGQEKDDEVSGEGNTNTAEYWEYDCRLGRRFNIDPKPNRSLNVYSCFNNNPIGCSDSHGDTTTYYDSKGKLMWETFDKLKNSIVVIKPENEQKFLEDLLFHHTSDVDANAKLLRQSGIAYLIDDYMQVYKNSFKESNLSKEKENRAKPVKAGDKLYNEMGYYLRLNKNNELEIVGTNQGVGPSTTIWGETPKGGAQSRLHTHTTHKPYLQAMGSEENPRWVEGNVDQKDGPGLTDIQAFASNGYLEVIIDKGVIYLYNNNGPVIIHKGF